MKKSNKVMATMMAVVVAMNAMAVSAVAEDKFVPTKDGVYKTSTIDVYKSDAPTTKGTCDGAFADEADIVVNGEWADLTLYMVNDGKANYHADGMMTSIYFTYDGVDYHGEMTSNGYVDGTIEKMYAKASNFLFQVKVGEYHTSDAWNFKIPTAALADDLQGHSVLSYLPNNPQNLLLDMTYVAVADSNATSQAMEVTATIPANVATYEVSIPETITLSELSTKEDTTTSYNVTVDMDYVNKTIQVETNDAVLTNGTGIALPLTNTFGEDGIIKFTESGTVKGSLTVTAEDVLRVATEEEQVLSTFITFTITAE